MILSDLNRVPPGRWFYVEPATGLRVEGGDFWTLRNRVVAHRSLNGIHVGSDVDEEIQSWFCAQLSEEARKEYCREPEAPVTNPYRIVTSSDAKVFLSTLKHWLLKDRTLVPQAEAERRAEICSSCEFNVELRGCAGCFNLGLAVANVIGLKKTSYDSHLQGCQKCGCVLAALVHVPLDTLEQGHGAQTLEFPHWCWRNPSFDPGSGPSRDSRLHNSQ